MTHSHIVQFDKFLLDGTLAGLTVPGETVGYPSYPEAQRAAAFYERVAREEDFIRAAVTGNRYRVSNVQVHPVDESKDGAAP